LACHCVSFWLLLLLLLLQLQVPQRSSNRLTGQRERVSEWIVCRVVVVVDGRMDAKAIIQKDGAKEEEKEIK
jgi:hypothetical protein